MTDQHDGDAVDRAMPGEADAVLDDPADTPVDAGEVTVPAAGDDVTEASSPVAGNEVAEPDHGEQDTETLESLRAERDALRDLLQRVQADFVNYRKRAAAQLTHEVDRATGRMVEALLPVLDAAEAAYVRHPDEVGPLLNAMLTELRRLGLETLDLEGKPFDPEVADAVAHEEADGDSDGTVVVEVLRSGYRWKGKTLRPAMVRTKG